VSIRWPKKLKKEGNVFILFFYGLTLEGKFMSLLKFFCYLNMYLKLYLRLKFLGLHNYFFHKLYVLLRFSCLICMGVVAHHIFFNLFGLFFVQMISMEYLVDLLVLHLRFRNMRQRKYIEICHIFSKICGTSYLNLENISIVKHLKYLNIWYIIFFLNLMENI
jgi:hypothetical protein